jgi:hypothetical protein
MNPMYFHRLLAVAQRDAFAGARGAGTTALFVMTRGHPTKVLPSPVPPERKAAKRRLDQAAAMR